MEIVKKQIYLNPYISRHFSLIPYIVKDVERQTSLTMGFSYIEPDTFSDNGNYGAYPYDIDIMRCDIFETHSGLEIDPRELATYFTSTKVSFKELSDKFALLKKIVCEAKYYKAINKNNKIIWVEEELTFAERLSKRVYSAFPTDVEARYDICGIYEDDSYNENGGKEMLLFLFKAMGMFVVDPLYISENNGVPEVMYYTGIKSYLDRMDKVKNSDICCVKNEYNYLGGDVFYSYLKTTLSKIKNEINYWFTSLYRVDNAIPEPVIHMSLGINEECHNIGNYVAIPNTTGDTYTVLSDNYKVRTIQNESPLKKLRKTKITYCEKYMGDDVWERQEFPLILEGVNPDENGVYEGYVLTQPYIENYPKNKSITNGGVYYGDMIYRMDWDASSGYVGIYYVIGGQLSLTTDEEWEYVHKSVNFSGNVNISNFIKTPTERVSVDEYLFIKDKLNDLYNNVVTYTSQNIFFKSNVNDVNEIICPSSNSDEVWVYRINFRKDITITNSIYNYYVGDYVIATNNSTYLFNQHRIFEKNFSGIRYYEKKKWQVKNYADTIENGEIYRIYMLFDDKSLPINILDNINGVNEDGELIVQNLENVNVVDYINMNDDVEGLFVSNEFANANISNNLLIMNDYDFGKVEMIVENVQDILIDRGFVSTFELHYKLSEINTMEDMENYGNNFFGL